jgi:hypothetical protein
MADVNQFTLSHNPEKCAAVSYGMCHKNPASVCAYFADLFVTKKQQRIEPI